MDLAGKSATCSATFAKLGETSPGFLDTAKTMTVLLAMLFSYSGR